ncbi:MAG: TetR/AcrR family transcriptional regulator [Chloroflexota bacterium]
MSPRPYRLGRRQAAATQTRARIVAAARELLATSGGVAGFSIDAVGVQAGVARMTVYYQFGSKRGLLEALFDDLAARGEIGERLPAAFSRPEPLGALAALVAAFAHFWASDRLVIRRLRSLAALDTEMEQGLRARDERRRQGLRVIVGRLAARYGRPAPEAIDETVDVLHMLTSFESFDSLAGATRSPEDVAPVVLRLARAVLGLDNRAVG